jgi:8-oxo-dGTP pyrophosphatase MutT (NUDIX family)
MAGIGKSPRRTDAQFAALPWRVVDGVLEVLLITSRETRRWVIPKGWPMKGRSPAEAAAQEAYEEAGVTGVADAEPLGAYAYPKRRRDGSVQQVKVQVFALQVLTEETTWREQGQREKLWTSPAEAADRVDEPELQALIRAFAP